MATIEKPRADNPTAQIKCRARTGEAIYADLQQQIGCWLQSGQWPEEITVDIRLYGERDGAIHFRIDGDGWFAEYDGSTIEHVSYRIYGMAHDEDWVRVRYLICEVE